MQLLTLAELMDGIELAYSRASLEELMQEVRAEFATCKNVQEEEE